MVWTIIFGVCSALFLSLFLLQYSKLLKSVKELDKPLREGYYQKTVNFSSKPNSKVVDTYSLIVYVEELDRFTNGESKIRLVNIEVVAGYNDSMYGRAKAVTREDFCSIKKTADIEWLESEEAVKALRKKKLEEIMK